MQRHPGHTGGSRSQISLFPGTETTSLRPTVEWCSRIRWPWHPLSSCKASCTTTCLARV
jgi:hypothetical protein